MRLRTSEWITIAYFAYLLAAAVVRRNRPRSRRRVAGVAAAVVIAVVAITRFGTPATPLRDWIPLAYVLAGYWLPASFVTSTNQRFERTLLMWDQRRFGIRDANATHELAPRAWVELLELAYLFCYPMIPVGFACLYAAGLHDETDRFWTAVLLAVFGCYGVLPWLPTRPPRAIVGEPTRSPRVIRRLNLRVLGVASIQLNTFPSGHAAASVATALAVGVRLPFAGLALGLLALGIAIGSVVGRYHYAADALAGAGVGIVGFGISRLV
jgi:membrane-associated phospholipid phosphatase